MDKIVKFFYKILSFKHAAPLHQCCCSAQVTEELLEFSGKMDYLFICDVTYKNQPLLQSQQRANSRHFKIFLY